MKTLRNLQDEQGHIMSGIEHPRLGNVVGLFEEVGELAQEVMEIEMYGENRKNELADECADVLVGLISLCNSYDIDLEGAYEKKILKIKDKIPDWREKYGDNLKKMRGKMD
ncbi:MAG: MazG nucleotide pyrophosphohydrolase domain-containing protein [Candidatus Pacebacteria bacterium]|nr:MazG nucleotide pyrophosphohydrolase domain-containing protein [Candidatus Paceibacterota bacterium]